jgi:hypothetical protein
MKYFLLYILPMLSFSEYAKNDITKVTITRVSFYINTVTDVSCDDFDNQMSASKDKITLTDKYKINFVHRQLSTSKEVEAFSMDARAKMFIYHKTGKVDTVCIDSRKFELNGQSRIFENDSMVNWIENYPRQQR